MVGLLGLLACSDGPLGLGSADTIEGLERELEAAGHLECRDRIRELWFELTTLTPRERLEEIRQVAVDCVESLRQGHRSLSVATMTTGDDIDPDGYTVTIGRERRRIAANGTVTFKRLEVGSHSVELGDMAANCMVLGSNPQSVEVTADRSESAVFEVVCHGEGEGQNDPDYTTVTCPGLALAASSGIPLDRIAIGRLPEAFQPPFAARVVTEGDDAASFTPVLSLDDGSAQLVAPIHPTFAADGGPVGLTFTDGAHACAPVDFTIAPLPPAPGAADALIGKIRRIIELQVSGLGLDPAEVFATDPADQSGPVALLAVLHQALEGETNPNSLASILQGEAPILAGHPIDPDLRDRILARTGVLADLDQQILALEGTISGRRSPRALDPAANGFDCDGIGLPDAAELDYCMELASSYAFERDMGANNETFDNLGLVFAAGRLVPLPAAQAVSIAGGTVIAMRRYILDAVASIHPSHFTSIRFEAAPLEFLEDEERIGVWHSLLVTARSDGFRRDQAVLDAVAPFIGAFHDEFSMSGTDLGDALGALTDDYLGATGNVELLEIPPRDFGPVDLVFGATFGVWSESEVEGDAIELHEGDSYTPIRAGSADLIVRPRPDRFGSAPPIETRKTIEVKAIDLDIEPGEATVEANEILVGYFTVTVENSASPELVEIDRSNASMPLQGTASIQYVGDAQHLVSYTAPPTVDVLPDFLTVRHSAETGARAPEYDPPERNATAVIRGGRIVVSPDGICLEPGDTQQFQEEVIGLENTEVTWSETGGAGISSTGLLTAPQETGLIEVIATSVENPNIEGRAIVQVGGCSCRWSVSVGSGRIDSQNGDHASFTVGSSGSQIMAISFFDENVAPGATTSTVSRTVPVDAIGSFLMPVNGTIGISLPDLSYGSGTGGDDEPVTTLNLIQNTGEILQGNLTGSVLVSGFQSGMPTERVVSFSAEFLITRDPGLSGTDPVSGLEVNACEIGQ